MDQIVLFGDSLTQFSGDQSNGFAFKAAVEHAYIRKLDVVNRGFSGYNTKLALRVLPHLIPPPAAGRIRLFVIFLGANDARLPGAPPVDQCVDLPDYIANLNSILDHESLVAHRPKFLLITPPPIDERLCEAHDLEKGYSVSRRSAVHTARYAEAVRQIGKERGVPVLDLWRAFMLEAGYGRAWEGQQDLPGSRTLEVNARLGELVKDGLHFSSAAYEIMFREFMKTVRQELVELAPERLDMAFPEWKDEEGWGVFNGRVHL